MQGQVSAAPTLAESVCRAGSTKSITRSRNSSRDNTGVQHVKWLEIGSDRVKSQSRIQMLVTFKSFDNANLLRRRNMEVSKTALIPAGSPPAWSYFWKISRHSPTSVVACSREMYHITTW